MNSDPYDSAAWRTFGMLDADESAIFDEAMRHDPVLRSAYLEMDRLSAAIAATSIAPVEPRAGQLERLQNRLGLYPVKRAYLWLGISGWAAAAALALLMIFTRNSNQGGKTTTANTGVTVSPVPSAPVNPPSPARPSANATATVTPSADTPPSDAPSADAPLVATTTDPDVKTTVKVETKRLIQEIEVLRESLQKFHERDRVLFEAVPGMALPIVMTMAPPGSFSEKGVFLAQNEEHTSITAMLGDALRSVAPVEKGMAVNSATPLVGSSSEPLTGAVDLATAGPLSPSADPTAPPAEPLPPSAIPIYDAARDAGTLVVSNLPETAEGEVYNLWVNTQSGDKPIYVGSLPQTGESGADSFDFSLGSTMVLPSGFVLTKDPAQAPSTPTTSNTVLQGPPRP